MNWPNDSTDANIDKPQPELELRRSSFYEIQDEDTINTEDEYQPVTADSADESAEDILDDGSIGDTELEETGVTRKRRNLEPKKKKLRRADVIASRHTSTKAIPKGTVDEAEM